MGRNFQDYDGSLDDVDAYQAGITCKQQGGHYERDCPAEQWYGKTAEQRAFLHAFGERFYDGWFAEHRKQIAIDYQRRQDAFSACLPAVGSELWVEHDSNRGHYYRYRIELIATDQRAVVASSLEEKDHGTLKVLGHPSSFCRFYTDRPASADTTESP